MGQNQQFEDAMRGLTYAKESLDPARYTSLFIHTLQLLIYPRLRNHDLLTSLDVLTTGSYLRLPSAIKKLIIPVPQLSDAEVLRTLQDTEDAIRYRLRMWELVPVEMGVGRIENGRVYFRVPGLFEASLCVRGAGREEGWFFVHVEFLLTIGGDLTGMEGMSFFDLYIHDRLN